MHSTHSDHHINNPPVQEVMFYLRDALEYFSRQRVKQHVPVEDTQYLACCPLTLTTINKSIEQRAMLNVVYQYSAQAT